MSSLQMEQPSTPSLFLNVNSFGTNIPSAIDSISLAVNFNPDCPEIKRKYLETILTQLFNNNFQSAFFPDKKTHCNTHKDGIVVVRIDGDNAFQY